MHEDMLLHFVRTNAIGSCVAHIYSVFEVIHDYFKYSYNIAS